MQANTIDLGTYPIEINGKKHIARAYAEVLECPDLDLSWAKGRELKAIERQLNSGILSHVFIMVHAQLGDWDQDTAKYACEIEGQDSLSGCLIKGDADVRVLIADHSMVDQALADLLRNVNDAIRHAKTFQDKYGAATHQPVSFDCPLCGQHIRDVSDGKGCGCGARG